MTPANLDLPMRRGVDFGPVIITCLDSNGDAVDLTTYTPHAHARTQPTGLLAFDLEPEVYGDPTLGKISITKTKAQIDALSDGRYGWDLLLEDGSGVFTGPYVAGIVPITSGFTRT